MRAPEKTTLPAANIATATGKARLKNAQPEASGRVFTTLEGASDCPTARDGPSFELARLAKGVTGKNRVSTVSSIST